MAEQLRNKRFCVVELKEYPKEVVYLRKDVNQFLADTKKEIRKLRDTMLILKEDSFVSEDEDTEFCNGKIIGLIDAINIIDKLSGLGDKKEKELK